MAAGDLTTVENLREWLRIEGPSDDTILAACVSASSAWVKREIGREYVVTDYVYNFSGDGTRGVALPNTPVVSVSGVYVNDEAIPERTDVTGSGWVRSGDRVELVGYRFTQGVENIQIVYRAGETAPADVAQAAMEHAAIRYWDRDWRAATSRSVGGDTVDRRGEVASGSWAFILSVIAHYRAVYT